MIESIVPKRNYVLHENKPLQTDNYGHLINFIAHYHRELIKLTAITCRNYQKYTNSRCQTEALTYRELSVYIEFLRIYSIIRFKCEETSENDEK